MDLNESGGKKIEKWREKDWWRGGDCDDLGKGEENLVGRKKGECSRGSGSSQNGSCVGEIRGHHGSRDRYGGPTDWRVRGEHRGLWEVGRVERTETVANMANKQGVVTEKGESAVETDDRESAVETDNGLSAVETDDGESEAETDYGKEPRGEYLMVAYVEEDIIFGSKKGYPTALGVSAGVI